MCLGSLAAGTYVAVGPKPKVTYTVPAGWGIADDSAGGILLIPPDGDAAGVDPGTSSYIGLHTGVALADAKCTDRPQPGVGKSARAIADGLLARPGLKTSGFRGWNSGGNGPVIEIFDIRLADGWKQAPCEGFTPPHVPLLIGPGDPPDFGNAITGNFAIRLYLLDMPGATWAIEADDMTGGSELDSYSQIIEAMQIPHSSL